jgi:hypothetical protein
MEVIKKYHLFLYLSILKHIGQNACLPCLPTGVEHRNVREFLCGLPDKAATEGRPYKGK